MDTANCTTCGKPENAGYYNNRRDERCCDPCHGPWLVPISSGSARFIAFHGKRKARRLMRRTY